MGVALPRRDTARKRLGLIVNPLAGIGGRVGLKGSDGLEIQRQALALGAVPQAGERARQALEILSSYTDHFDLFTPPGEMGEGVALQCGFKPYLLTEIVKGATTPDDSLRAAIAMQESSVDLLLFAGGDGTARDIYRAVGISLPVLGIPAGVKIHSAVFANHPRGAGELALACLQSSTVRLREAEVVDLDEEAYRLGRISTRLYGYLKIPYRRTLVQNQKVPTPAGEAVQAGGIAAEVVESMLEDWLYILGPGTTPRAIADRLGLEKTLVGVDVITRHALVARDASEARLLELLDYQPAKIIVTPIGGQGFLFGRGNQPISPRVIRKAGVENIIVVSLPHKVNALRGKPLLVDTGDPDLDRLLAGYITVHTGYGEKIIYKVRDGS